MINARLHTTQIALLVAAAALAAGCDRAPTQPTAQPSATSTVGEKVDTAIAKTADTAKDVAVTAAIKTELAKDPGLSALSINVDTTAGRVLLKGKAPDSAAAERATEIARRTEGVVSVENQLTVEPKG
jgi:hyperosmotically inducible periplasmic protein